MSLLNRVLPWRSVEEHTVQYEIHRMTHRGGWTNPWKGVYIHEPQPRPTDDDDSWILDPGRYRHIRRVDGRIDEVLWTYETDDAEDWYERKRIEERQRERLQVMTFEEVQAEYWGETDQLGQLGSDEIGDRYEVLRDRQSETEM